MNNGINEDFDKLEPSAHVTATEIQDMLFQGEFEAAKVEKMQIFEEFNSAGNVKEELTQQHEAQLAEMAMTMDTELFKMKEEYERKLEDLQLQALSNTNGKINNSGYSETNTEDDENKIGLILNTGTLKLKIKSQQKKIDRLQA